MRANRPRELVEMSGIHNAVSDPSRLKVLFILKESPLCVCVLKQLLDMPDSKLSYHLGVLKEVGLVLSKREGSYVIYELTDKGLKVLER